MVKYYLHAAAALQRRLIQLVVVGLRGVAAGRDDIVIMRCFVLRDTWGLSQALAVRRAQKRGSNAV